MGLESVMTAEEKNPNQELSSRERGTVTNTKHIPLMNIKLHPIVEDQTSCSTSLGDLSEQKENDDSVQSGQKTDAALTDLKLACQNVKSDYLRGPLANMRHESREKTPWSTAELNALIQGVKKFGLSNWKQVLYESRDIFHPKRRPIDLIDKYRQYTKSTSFYTAPKRNWVEVNQDGTYIYNKTGEVAIFKEKFPYDAAIRFARRKLAGAPSGTEALVIIQDIDIPDKVHVYSARAVDNGIKVRKMRSD